MPYSRIFTAGLALAASLCSAVYATPAPMHRRQLQQWQGDNFACDSWPGGVRIFEVVNGNIVELSLQGNNAAAGPWTRNTAFPQASGFQISNNAVLSATSVWYNNALQQQIFFVDTSNTLRSYMFDGQNWVPGSIQASMPEFSGYLSADAWVENGNVIVSVFYTEGNFLKEFTSTNNNWAWGGNIGSIQPNTEFASAVISNNGYTKKMLFTAASTVWTNSNNGGWSQSYGNFTTQDVYATVLSDNTLRVFTNNGNQDIAEWYYDQNGNGGQNTQYFRGQTMNGGSDICATSQTTSRGLVDVYLFYRDLEGNLAFDLFSGHSWGVKGEVQTS